MKYKKVLGTSLVKYNNKFYIITNNRKVFNVNEVGARIFDLCNGINTKEDISKMIKKIYDKEIDQISKDVDKYLKELVSLNLIIPI